MRALLHTAAGRVATPWLLVAALVIPTAGQADTIRLAFPDIATVEYTHFLTALERAKERGLDIDVTYFKTEDLAVQAVVSDNADIGLGSPFAVIQKIDTPIRAFLQLSELRFYVVAEKECCDSWEKLDGKEVAVHARGSGTEAVMKMMASRKGIEYASMSYVPGSEVRAGAMLQGTLKVTVVDSINRDLLLREAPDRFVVLPVDTSDATNDALYAHQDFLNENAEAVDTLVESIITTWREMVANPEVVAEWREQYNLLPDMPQEVVDEMLPYYRDATQEGTFPLNGGSEEAARQDMIFYAAAGQIQGDPETLDINDFWDFSARDRALGKLGEATE